MSDYITQDLVYLILKWIPVKTLLQWRCISKSWKQLIDSTPFILDHLSVQRSRIILQNKNFEYLLLDPQTLPLYDTLTGPHGIEICNSYHCLSVVCSVHGVICLHDLSNLLLLWNPSINQVLSIPLPENYTSLDGLMEYGFCIDPSSNDFKIVIICFSEGIVFLYSSTEQEWIEDCDIDSDVELDDLWASNEAPQVLIEGVAYWSALESQEDEESQEVVIIFFDFVEEMFGKIELPELPATTFMVNVCKWKDLLSFVHWQSETAPYACDLWVMENESWSKISTFNLMNNMGDVYVVFEDWGRVLGSIDEELVVYDPKDGCIPVSVKFRKTNDFCFATDFVESLVFPDGECISRD